MNKSIIVAASLLSTLSGASFAQAAVATPAKSGWAASHPRRAQVNHRLANQNARIHHEVKDGEMSKAQAAQLHKDDHQVRQEERDMASQNGGHITRQEQRTLNQQENRISNQIGH